MTDQVVMDAIDSFGQHGGETTSGGKMPISFEDFKKQKEKQEKDEKERVEKEKKKARDAADEARRRARKEERVKVDDKDLEGMRGYKTRADGSKTSYFNREIDEETKRLLDEQKKPKRLSVGAEAPPAAAGSSVGSAWNLAGTTWEDKDFSDWAKEELTSRLKAAAGECDGVRIKVSAVKEVDGSASVVATRGTQRHLFDYAFELEYKVTELDPPPAEAEAAGADDDAPKK